MTDTFYDAETEFRMDIHFEPLISNIQDVYNEERPRVAQAIELFKRMEKGEVVNHTAVKAESEDRQVDHYNHRLEEEIVPGKSLAHTLALWEDTLKFVNGIKSGEIKPSSAPKYTTVIFNGIGGSYLGPQMLIFAKYSMDFNTISNLPFKIYFISNTDSDLFHEVVSKIDLASSIMVHLSKSGSTAETAGNTQTWCEMIVKAGLNLGEHNACVTIKDSRLDKIAHENKYLKIWHMEIDTGGRTSVCSAIGMAPCAFAGLDFAEFIKGMSAMDKMTRRPILEENPAAIIASLIDHTNRTVGHRNMIVLCYSEFMKEYAHYLQQLYMESLGKEYKVDGTPAHEGQTVFGGVGTGEQHAFMQQVQKGIADCFVRTIFFEKRHMDFVNDQAGSMGRQHLAFLEGTQKALLQNKRPFIGSVFSERNEFNFGMMIALEERIVSFLASMMEINAYDQPGVQDGKKAASAVNALSKMISEKLAKIKTNVKGTAQEILTALEIPGQHYEAEAVLNDIVVNHAVPNSYPGLVSLKASKSFDKSKKCFIFSFN